MYEELIRRLWECISGECFNCSQYTPTTNVSVCQKELMRKAANAIEGLSNAGSIYGKAWTLGYDAGRDENRPRWIPVTERLPEDKERVLIFYWLSTKPKTPWYKVATFSTKLSDVDEYDLYGKDHPGFYGSDSEYGYYEHTDVEYWMALPQPPKEET